MTSIWADKFVARILELRDGRGYPTPRMMRQVMDEILPEALAAERERWGKLAYGLADACGPDRTPTDRKAAIKAYMEFKRDMDKQCPDCEKGIPLRLNGTKHYDAYTYKETDCLKRRSDKERKRFSDRVTDRCEVNEHHKCLDPRWCTCKCHQP